MKNNNHIYDMCKNHMHAYVLAETHDGNKFDGIITGLDDEFVYFAVPTDNQEGHGMQEDRQFGFGYGGGYPGYGYPGYGHGYGYGYGYPRRRFNRLILPLAALTALSVLPWY
ncbi:hypothetical protein VBD025_17125 [Virgibacillus flavescens]|uniref:hypothetical protein n=1 Tax=Virgibacillus flavescens TaxID=1611422 RepID=UPI003D356556